MRKLLGTILCLALLASLFAGFAVAEELNCLHRRFSEPCPSGILRDDLRQVQGRDGHLRDLRIRPLGRRGHKLTVLGTSGQLPDVLTTWAGWLGQFTAANWVIPLDNYVAGTEGEYADTVTKLV
jgi:multiple sugar transport system substrate-binding protein